MTGAMRRSAVLALVVTATGCPSALDTGVVLVGSTGEASTFDPSDASVDTSTSTITSDRPTSSSTESTTSEATTRDATSDDASESSSSTGEVADGVDSPCGSEQKVCALVERDGEPVGSCGETLDLKGIVQAVMPGVWRIEDCGVCELCGGPSYTVEIVAPHGWAPAELPVCSRIAVEYAPNDATPWACSFVGVAIWSDDGLGEEAAPRYIGRSIETSAPSGVSGLYVTPEPVHPEPCDEARCCALEPGKYALTFAGAGIGRPLVLEENQTAHDVQAWSRIYDVHVVRSHAHRECNRIPHFDWVFLR